VNSTRQDRLHLRDLGLPAHQDCRGMVRDHRSEELSITHAQLLPDAGPATRERAIAMNISAVIRAKCP
jgi:hypothetical protein